MHNFIFERREIQTLSNNYFSANDDEAMVRDHHYINKLLNRDDVKNQFLGIQLQYFKEKLELLGFYSAQIIGILIIYKIFTSIIEFLYNIVNSLRRFGLTWRLLLAGFNNINQDVNNINRGDRQPNRYAPNQLAQQIQREAIILIDAQPSPQPNRNVVASAA